jgi:branched-chain amino acid transport system substrate-binding protein
MENQNLSQTPPETPVETTEPEKEHETDLSSKAKAVEGNKTNLVIAAVVIIVLILAGIFFWQSKSIEERSKVVAVVVSVPLNQGGGRDIANAVTLAFEEVNYMAGNTQIELIELDGGDENGLWQESSELDNAYLSAAENRVVAYIGPLNSGAAKVSMPILNRAGIAQVSPAATWPGLTKEGFFPAEPDKFYPTGERHFSRVVTTDDFQGPAGAIWAKELGFNSVYILDDGESYGKGVADLFRDRALDIGMTVFKHMTLDKTSTDFSNEVDEIKELNPDLVYYGGITRNGGPHLLQQMRAAGVGSAFMGADGIASSDFIIKAGSDNAEGVYATTVGVFASYIGTPEAVQYSNAYKERFGIESEIFGAFGYEAAKVVIAAIERADVKNRKEIREEIINTKDYKGIFGGTWSFDEQGDTTLKIMSGNVVRDGAFNYVKTFRLP